MSGVEPTDIDVVGHWSDSRLYIGGMQDSSLYFLPSGVGWAEFWNGGGSEQRRFRWTLRGDRLSVQIDRSAWVELIGRDYAAPVERDEQRPLELVVTVAPGQDALERDCVILELDRPILHGDRFAFVRRELTPNDDRVGWALRL